MGRIGPTGFVRVGMSHDKKYWGNKGGAWARGVAGIRAGAAGCVYLDLNHYSENETALAGG